MFHRSSTASNSDDGHASDGGGPLPVTTQDPTTSQNQEIEEKPQPHPTGHESLLRFLLLPNQVLIVLTLEFLNSFRSFGLRFVLYNYVTNEFGISDVKAGALLGTKGFIDIIFGTIGSIM